MVHEYNIKMWPRSTTHTYPDSTLPHHELFCGYVVSAVKILQLMVLDVNGQTPSGWGSSNADCGPVWRPLLHCTQHTQRNNILAVTQTTKFAQITLVVTIIHQFLDVFYRKHFIATQVILLHDIYIVSISGQQPAYKRHKWQNGLSQTHVFSWRRYLVV